jgi:hypothetical protein
MVQHGPNFQSHPCLAPSNKKTKLKKSHTPSTELYLLQFNCKRRATKIINDIKEKERNIL